MLSRSEKTSLVLPFPGAKRVAAVPPLTASLLPVLIVLHQESSRPGRVGNALRALGHPLDIRRPRFGDALPETLDQHAGAIIFGGPMSANDGDDYVRREIDWIEVPLREQRPFLGICLGATARRQSRTAPGGPRGNRLLSDPSDRCWPRALPGLAGAGLSLASRRI
jgi:GMP synthase (glutamine-hydrolysing)